MKGMLAITLIAPLASWAQTHLPARVVTPELSTPQQALKGSANPHYLRLPAGTFLYRQLSDTISHRYAKSLPRGDWSLEITQQVTSRWVAVRWRPGYNLHSFGADTTTDYMPKAALKGAYTVVEI
jgi:hypothetical protein